MVKNLFIIFVTYLIKTSSMKKKMPLLVFTTAAFLAVFTFCKKSQKSSSSHVDKGSSFSASNYARQTPESCNDLVDEQTPNPTNVSIIKITGVLRRPKILECNGKIASCYCGLGLCDVHMYILGVQVFRTIPSNPGPNNPNSPVKDGAIIVPSKDGKYALVRFDNLDGNDREINKDPFIIDDTITLTNNNGSKAFCQKIPAQTAYATFYDNFNINVTNVIRELSVKETGAEDNSYFYFSVENLNLSSAEAVAIIRLN